MQNTTVADLKCPTTPGTSSAVSADWAASPIVTESKPGRPSLQRRLTPSATCQRPAGAVASILVSTDFSPASAAALAQAAALASQWGASLSVLHVVDVNAPTRPAEWSAAKDLMTGLWAEAASRLGELKRSLRSQMEVDTVIREGIPSEEIVEMSRKVDLVILGQPGGRKGWSLFSRRTVERVIQDAACAVMVVPHPTAADEDALCAEWNQTERLGAMR